ncbi:hypothetical protein GGX14DRAFT_675942 [Mycena pura]|uniref:Transmembrane protein n=1 Tax=Mycena pura TaxID=153505 RepID=A0AAD6YHU0_9AGAR|nr:hypothetical protein GGX14DRAFT_675942 [Mycena pura]
MSQPFSIIDDRDPSVQYTGTWVVGGTSHEYAGTVSSSLKSGDHFQVPFTGTGIAVYGTLDASSGGVKTSYSVDGATADTVTSGSSGQDSYQQLFWQSDPFSGGPHTLTVAMVAVNNVGGGEGTVWFDFFNVTHGAASALVASSSVSALYTSSPASAGANTIAGTTAYKTSKGSSTATSAASSATSSSRSVVAVKKTSHIALIAGVIVVVALVLFAAAIFHRRRRQARRYFPSVTNKPPPPFASPPPNSPPPTQPFFQNPAPAPPARPMSGIYGSAALLYGASHTAPASPAPAPAPYSPVPGPGGFDPRLRHNAGAAYAPLPTQSYAPPQRQAHAPSDAYAAIGESMLLYAGSGSGSVAPSSYAPSAYASSAPSSSARRGPLSVVGGAATDADGDSVVALKRRQQQVVDSYEHGLASGSAQLLQQAPTQHVDSGLRGGDTALKPHPMDLPPVYTPN